MSDFKAPSAVWVNENSAKDFAEGRMAYMEAGYRWFHKSNAPLIQYTLTTTAEENTRKAVMKVYNAMQAHMDLIIEELNETVAIAAAHGWKSSRGVASLKLRLKSIAAIEPYYTEPQPTEEKQ